MIRKLLEVQKKINLCQADSLSRKLAEQAPPPPLVPGRETDVWLLPINNIKQFT